MLYKAASFILVCCLIYLLKIVLSKEPTTFDNRVKYYAKFWTYYIVSCFILLVMLPIHAWDPGNRNNLNCTTRLLKQISIPCQIDWKLRNGHHLAEDRGAIIVSNHQSSLDVLGIFNIWETCGKLAVVAKQELYDYWLIGLSIYLSGAILFVDRKNSKRAYEQLNVASNIMVRKRKKIWLFPEGTRNKDYTTLLPFKKGAFSMAVRAQVPIIPVIYSPYYFINPSQYLFNKGQVIIKCLEPIPTKGLTEDDLPDLISRVRELMLAEYRELSKEVLKDLPPDYPYSTAG